MSLIEAAQKRDYRKDGPPIRDDVGGGATLPYTDNPFDLDFATI